MIRTSNEIRYERKFCLSRWKYDDIKFKILNDTLRFKPIFKPRVVNSVYFDTNQFKFFWQNIDGEKLRKKYRFRWYGNYQTLDNQQFNFEIKSRNGLLVNKESIPIKLENPTIEHIKTNYDFFLKLFLSKENDLISTYEKNDKYPWVHVYYNREYFISQDKNIRITIDNDITYKNLQYLNKGTSTFKEENIVVECKYQSGIDNRISTLVSRLGISLGKNSKYQNAISKLRLI